MPDKFVLPITTSSVWPRNHSDGPIEYAKYGNAVDFVFQSADPKFLDKLREEHVVSNHLHSTMSLRLDTAAV